MSIIAQLLTSLFRVPLTIETIRAALRTAREAIASRGVTVHFPTQAISVDASRLRSRHPISLPDGYLLATVEHTGAMAVSFDRKVVRAARAEGIPTRLGDSARLIASTGFAGGGIRSLRCVGFWPKSAIFDQNPRESPCIREYQRPPKRSQREAVLGDTAASFLGWASRKPLRNGLRHNRSEGIQKGASGEGESGARHD